MSPLDLILIDKCSLWSGVFHFPWLPGSSHGGRKPFPTSSGRKIPRETWIGFGYTSTSEPIPVDRGIRYFGHPDLGGMVSGLKPYQNYMTCVRHGKECFCVLDGQKQQAGTKLIWEDLRWCFSLEAFEGGTKAYHNVIMGLPWWSSA